MCPGKHPLKLGRRHPVLQPVVHLLHLCQRLLVIGLLTQLYQDTDILPQSGEAVPVIQQLFNYGTFFQDLLGAGGIIPETGCSDPGIQLL